MYIFCKIAFDYQRIKQKQSSCKDTTLICNHTTHDKYFFNKESQSKKYQKKYLHGICIRQKFIIFVDLKKYRLSKF